MNFGSVSCCSAQSAQFRVANLASVHALVGDEGLGVVLEPVGVAESDPGERSAYSQCQSKPQISNFEIGYSPRPESWTISFTTPRMYPLRSACHPLARCSQVCPISRLCAGGGTYVVERAELGGGLVQAGVGREDRAATLTLVANYPTHGDGDELSASCR
jgi:hypothetical protein